MKKQPPTPIEILAGSHISKAVTEAVAQAKKLRKPVSFEFNDITLIATVRTKPEALVKRYSDECDRRHEQWLNSPAGIAETKRRAEEAVAQAEREKRHPFVSEKKMCAMAVPSCATIEELTAFVATLTDRPHDYGTCVYAMSMAATAAFNYVASVLGVTGFQASCADLDILRRTRNLKGPFIVLKAEDSLYPQYDLLVKLSEAVASWQPWLKKEAKAKLKEHASDDHVHPQVRAHWERLATARIPRKAKA